jgi:hypothetical protein
LIYSDRSDKLSKGVAALIGAKILQAKTQENHLGQVLLSYIFLTKENPMGLPY